MEFNEKKKNGGLIVVIILLIVLCLGLGGFIVYDKLLKEEPKKVEKSQEVVEKTDFYDISELVKNKYIKKVESTFEKDFMKKSTEIEIKDGKVYVIDNSNEMVEAKGIEGTPKYVAIRHFSGPNNYFVVTEEGDLYYLSLIKLIDEDKTDCKFDKINTEKIINIYVMYNPVTPGDYMNIYAETQSGELINFITSKTFEEENPYPDTISVPGFSSLDSLYISPTRELYKYYYNDESSGYDEIKYNDQSLKIKDAFSFSREEVDGNGVSSDNINTFYLITEDNLLYEITVKAENFHLKYQDMTDKVKLHSSDKITKYVYDIKNNEYGDIDYAEVKITYENGQTETIKDLYAVSTLYERYNK